MSEELIQIVLEDAKEKMEKTLSHTRQDFSGVRTGRAAPSLVEKITINYHGTELPLQQLAGISVPDNQSLLISPYDENAIESIEKAINQADLGLTPNNDGKTIRLNFPPLTADRRKELAKVVRGMAEEGKVSIRNARRTARGELAQMNKDGEISDDQLAGSEKELDTTTKSSEDGIDEALALKEKELLEV